MVSTLADIVEIDKPALDPGANIGPEEPPLRLRLCRCSLAVEMDEGEPIVLSKWLGLVVGEVSVNSGEDGDMMFLIRTTVCVSA